MKTKNPVSKDENAAKKSSRNPHQNHVSQVNEAVLLEKVTGLTASQTTPFTMISAHYKTNSLGVYQPYIYQKRFHAAKTHYGKLAKQRVLQAANQIGKTECASMEVAIHASGEYPSWWQGWRWQRPVKIWIGGDTHANTRDILQKKLLGGLPQSEGYGQGSIPLAHLGVVQRQPNIPESISKVQVRHKNGGWSEIWFKTYQATEKQWRGQEVDIVWLDEEPPLKIYSHAIRATVKRDGIVLATYTPEKGQTDFVRFFQDQLSPEDQMWMNATWWDCPHFDEKRIVQALATLPPYERDLRSKGVATTGSGVVFPVEVASIQYNPAQQPLATHWPRIAAMDFGWEHPTAVAWLAHDVMNDVVYLYDSHCQSKALPAVHARAILARGAWIPMVWPRDGTRIEPGAGIALAEQYRRMQVKMLPEAFQNPGGGIAIEPGLWEMLQRMQTGRFKVADHLQNFVQELQRYHRKDGRAVALDDDLISATRYALMSLQFARTIPSALPSFPEYAEGLDYQP